MQKVVRLLLCDDANAGHTEMHGFRHDSVQQGSVMSETRPNFNCSVWL